MGSLTQPISVFDENTRQNIRDIPGITITGNRGQAILPKTGFLGRIHCHTNLTMTVTLGGGTAVLDAQGPWSIYNRVRAAINGGKEVYSVSGIGAHLVDTVLNDQYQPESSRVFGGDPTHSALVFQAGVGAGANPWDFGFTIPIAPNDNEMLGGFIVQTEAAQSTLTFDFNQTIFSTLAAVAPIVVTGAATAALTAGVITPFVETFDIPPDPSSWPPVQALHIINENEFPIAQTGDQIIDLLKDNVYLQVFHYLILNSVPTSLNFDRLKLAIQRNLFPYDMPARSLLQRHRYMYGRDLPPGLLMHDLFFQGFPNYGSFRDVINAMDLTEFQTILTVSSGATIALVSKLKVISRMLEPLKTPSVRMG